jgi:glucosamine--fructose-6-phosphate aminotransferase (isomerizing)
MGKIRSEDHALTSILEQEIREQPEVLRRLIETRADQAQVIMDAVRGRFNYILIAARGSSDNAARYAQYLFQIVNAVPVALATPSVFSLYHRAPKLDGALVLGISQSGQSPDIVSVLEEARRQGCPSIAITNDPKSPLAQAAQSNLDLQTGQEKAVAATKTYTASLLAIALLSNALAEDKAAFAEIQYLPAQVHEAVEQTIRQTSRMERYRYMPHGAVIGRGYNYSTAFEVALKIKELTGITTVPYSSADFLHGPVASLNRGYPVFAIASSGVMVEDMSAIIERANAMQAEVVVISDREELLSLAQLPLPIPHGVPEWLSPVVAVIPGQILAWQMALTRGLDPDKPKGLSKVTETL